MIKNLDKPSANLSEIYKSVSLVILALSTKSLPSTFVTLHNPVAIINFSIIPPASFPTMIVLSNIELSIILSAYLLVTMSCMKLNPNKRAEFIANRYYIESRYAQKSYDL